MEIENFLQKKHIIFLTAVEKGDAVKEILEKIKKLNKINNIENFYTQIMHRESLENTGIGNGFAIPHTRNDSLMDISSIFAVSLSGIDYNAYDKKPVKYLLLSLFPTNMSSKYLYLISMMTKIFLDTEKIKKLDEANTPVKTYTLLKQYIESYFNSISQKYIPDSQNSVNSKSFNFLNLDLLIRLDRLYYMLDTGAQPVKMKNKIDELKKLIDKRSLSYYEKMRRKKINPFTLLEKDSCSNCHMRPSPVQLSNIKELNEIQACNYCGKIIITV